MTTYSYSRISTFETCPLKFKFQYIDRIKTDDKGIEAFMGSRVHDSMEKLYNELKFKVLSLEEVLTFYGDIWEKNFDDKVVIVRKDRTAEDYKNCGRKCVEEYYKRYHPFDQGKVIGNEVPVKVALDAEGKYQMQGYIDRLVQNPDGSYEIHDYKTNSRLPEQKDMDEDRQLALYHIGISQKWDDVNKVELVWHYVVFDKEIRSRRNGDQLEELKQEYIRLIDEIESTEKYEPKVSSLCGWCSYQEICPTTKHPKKMEELPVNEYKKDPGVKLVKQYAKFEQEKGEFKTKIKEIECEQDKIKEAAIEFAGKEKISVIDGPDAVLKIDIKEELKGPTKTRDPEQTEKLKQLLIKENKLEEVASVSNSDLIKKIIRKEWPENIIREIEPFITKEEKKTVRLAKKKDVEK